MAEFSLSGGRGRKAPYETVVVRVPIDLLPYVERTCATYRQAILEGENAPVFSPVSEAEAKALADKIVSSKKGAKASMNKLVTSLFPNP